MAEPMSLDAVLDEKPAPREQADEAPAPKEPAAEPSAEPKVERVQSTEAAWQDKEQAAQGRVRDPVTGQFVAKEEAKPEAKAEPKLTPAKEEPAKPAAAAPAAPQQELTAKERAFLRAAEEERGKRQEWERRVAAGEYVKAQPAQPGAPTEPAKKFWDDPEGALAKHRQELEQVGVSTRLNTAEMIARSRHPDFGEKFAVFQEMLNKAGPNQAAFASQWIDSPDPAMFAYNFGKNQMELRQVGSLDAMKAKIEQETEAKVRAKVEAEFKAKSDAIEKERAALPGSLSDARSSGGIRPSWGGVPTLDDILK